MEVEVGCIRADVWVLSPEKQSLFPYAEEKLSRQMGPGKNVWLPFDKKRAIMLLRAEEKKTQAYIPFVIEYFIE